LNSENPAAQEEGGVEGNPEGIGQNASELDTWEVWHRGWVAA